MKLQSKEHERDLAKFPRWGWVLATATLIIWIAYPFTLRWALPSVLGLLPEARNGAQLGQLGDMFGALNCLFSTFAFVGLAVSLHMQRTQFQASLQDMKENAEASEHNARALERSNNIAAAQNSINAKQLFITSVNAQLSAKLTEYDFWRQSRRSSGTNDFMDNQEAQGRGIQNEIARLSKLLADLDVQSVVIE